MKEAESQCDQLDEYEISEDGPGSAVVRLFPDDKAGLTCDNSPQSDIIELWLRDNPHLENVISSLREIDVDLTPLRISLEDAEELDLLQVIFHMREYVLYLMTTLDLRVFRNVRAIRVHIYKSLSDSAIAYADDVAKSKNQDESSAIYRLLKDLHEWLSNEEKNSKLLMGHKKSMK